MPLRDYPKPEPEPDYIDDPIMKRTYGEEYVIVYKPKGLNYFITESHNAPPRTLEILRSVVSTIEGLRGEGTHDPGEGHSESGFAQNH